MTFHLICEELGSLPDQRLAVITKETNPKESVQICKGSQKPMNVELSAGVGSVTVGWGY